MTSDQIDSFLRKLKIDGKTEITLALLIEVLDLWDKELSHPQPAEVSAEEINKLRIEHINWVMGMPDDKTTTPKEHCEWFLERIAKMSLSPPPVRHMSDEEIVACLNWAFGQENYLAIDAEENGGDFGKYTLKAYRSFIQSQQNKNG